MKLGSINSCHHLTQWACLFYILSCKPSINDYICFQWYLVFLTEFEVNWGCYFLLRSVLARIQFSVQNLKRGLNMFCVLGKVSKFIFSCHNHSPPLIAYFSMKAFTMIYHIWLSIFSVKNWSYTIVKSSFDLDSMVCPVHDTSQPWIYSGRHPLGNQVGIYGMSPTRPWSSLCWQNT